MFSNNIYTSHLIGQYAMCGSYIFYSIIFQIRESWIQLNVLARLENE